MALLFSCQNQSDLLGQPNPLSLHPAKRLHQPRHLGPAFHDFPVPPATGRSAPQRRPESANVRSTAPARSSPALPPATACSKPAAPLAVAATTPSAAKPAKNSENSENSENLSPTTLTAASPGETSKAACWQLSNAQIREITQMSRFQVGRLMDSLKQEGLVQLDGSRCGTRWLLIGEHKL